MFLFWGITGVREFCVTFCDTGSVTKKKAYTCTLNSIVYIQCTLASRYSIDDQYWVILNSTEWTDPTINGFASAKDYGRGKLEERVIDKTQNLLQLTALSARMSSVEWDWFIRPRTMTFKAQGTDCMDINIFSVVKLVRCQSSIKVAHETRVQIISDNPVVNDWQRCGFRYEEVPYIRPYSYIKLGFSWCQCALIERWSAFS